MSQDRDPSTRRVWTCRKCGGETFVHLPRIASWLSPVLLAAICMASAVMAVVGTLGGIAVWAALSPAVVTFGVATFFLKTRAGQRIYWGGVKCDECDDFTMNR